MACGNCERLRKEMDEMRESMQLREFELEEKLNHLEDKVEWANEDNGKLKAELEDVTEQLEKYVEQTEMCIYSVIVIVVVLSAFCAAHIEQFCDSFLS